MASPNNAIGVSNLPNQAMAKRGGHFTLMVVGESGLGKTTLINTLFSTELAAVKDYKRRFVKQMDKTTEIGALTYLKASSTASPMRHYLIGDIIKAELEEKQFKVKLTVIDTPGFGDYVNNRDSWTPIVDFIDDQHESFMRQEQQPQRGEKVDMRVHACLYFIRPTGHTLKPLDIEIMKRLGTRVNLIPIVAKADTLTPNDLAHFKAKIREVIKAQGIRVYTPPVESDDEQAAEQARLLISSMPFSIIGSTEEVSTADGRTVKGREYLWGVAEVENEDHCDFKKLRALLIRTHMLDLISTSEESHYENYRQAQMETRKFGEPKVKKVENPKFKEEEEALRKRFTEQVKMEEARFRQWEQHLIAERDRLNKDLEQAHGSIKTLEVELDNLGAGGGGGYGSAASRQTAGRR
ncbi:cell division control protein 12, partial [Phenoliferia sp. Uapishka_3]